MNSQTPSSTDLSLLYRVRDSQDDSAWGEFVRRYGTRIYRWCLGWGVQQADAENITQEVLLQLVNQMREFEYDPKGRFRSWLNTVAHRAWIRYRNARGREAQPLDAQSLRGALDTLDAEDAQQDLRQQLESEYQSELFELASRHVRKRLDAKTWQAFELTALQGRASEEVAGELGLNLASVYQAKSRTQKLLKQELERLEGEHDQ